MPTDRSLGLESYLYRSSSLYYNKEEINKCIEEYINECTRQEFVTSLCDICINLFPNIEIRVQNHLETLNLVSDTSEHDARSYFRINASKDNVEEEIDRYTDKYEDIQNLIAESFYFDYLIAIESITDLVKASKFVINRKNVFFMQ